jgi:hypothetical protein
MDLLPSVSVPMALRALTRVVGHVKLPAKLA